MNRKLNVEVITPLKVYNIGEVDYIKARGVDGYFGVLPRHIPALIVLDIGEIAFDRNGKRNYIATSGGYCEIRKDRVLFLVETAEFPDQIDVERARESAERAKMRLKKRDPEIDVDRVIASMKRAYNRLAVARRIR
ncbi:MAG: F0F1 ATP synthase subunit epsilon [Fidelibacterota bacterium]